LNHQANFDTMKEQRESPNELEKLALEKAQPELSCSSNGSRPWPILDYEPVTSPEGESKINKAFDILFQEVMRLRIQIPHEISSDIRSGFDSPAGRRTDN
jgi:hypothetical protein